jgi:hypothetical protein
MKMKKSAEMKQQESLKNGCLIFVRMKVNLSMEFMKQLKGDKKSKRIMISIRMSKKYHLVLQNLSWISVKHYNKDLKERVVRR